MHPMQDKTPEERKAIAAKSAATRKANNDIKEAKLQESLKERQEALIYAGGLRQQIKELEERLSSLKHFETINMVAETVIAKRLLREEEIAAMSLPWNKASGVYFLLDGDKIVYVGQSVNVYSRIVNHTDKRFDRYAVISCPVDSLDILESLYIHCIQPRLNGNRTNDSKCAPITLDALIVKAASVVSKEQPPYTASKDQQPQPALS